MPGSQPNPGASPGVVAGIDHGQVRIGVALSDVEWTIATPHETYSRCNPQADARWFVRLAEEFGVKLFVVGLPVHLDGGESQQSQRAREFGRWLEEVTGVPVTYYDERFTTAQAEEHLLAAGLTSKRRKARRDQLAAQILLADFLDTGGQGQETPGPLDG